ncbi:hypothetical protein KIH86_21035 [Paenibacillus sp. HN-1]|uniref:Rgg family transcriptional regulator n=1 Tax=Paenibacillus TaxID=44249 RepID=UPI001CA86389|nr:MULTISPECIES: hypothetical protein [Paenibacillus]MBY9079995.1 hypothetical protein [Paenibacillus sp. CGMCC 1.18879]MBY9086693.1 hypothetical protein [Paenibacillus sinensis]
MDHPGVTARAIRLSKGFSQKEIYTGIISKSFAISFEQGKVMLNHFDFVQVLDRLSLSWSEFEFIHGGYQNSENVSLWRQFAEAANTKDRVQLEVIYHVHQDDKSDFGKVVAYLSRAFLNNMTADSDQPSEPCTDKETRFLIRYLMDKESWMLDETNLFTSFYYLFEEQTQETLIRNCYRSLQRYRKYPGYPERMFNLLTNYIAHCYATFRRDEGDEWLNRLREMPRSKTYLHQVVNARFCEAIHCAAHGQEKAGRETAEECSTVFRVLGFLQEATAILDEFEAFLALYRGDGRGERHG